MNVRPQMLAFALLIVGCGEQGLPIFTDAFPRTDFAVVDMTTTVDMALSADQLLTDGGLGDSGLVLAPRRVKCDCADGIQVLLCVSVSCSSPQALDTTCVPSCMQHGGLSKTDCSDLDPTCTPTFPGPDQVSCLCMDGRTFNVCAKLDCNLATQSVAVCNVVCAPMSGVKGIGCMSNYEFCPQH